MGILWWKRKSKTPDATTTTTTTTTAPPSEAATAAKSKAGETAEGMNGAMEVQRFPKDEVTVFEFGSVATSADKVTLAGYCPVSEQLEPCRWEILPADDSYAPQFRIVF